MAASVQSPLVAKILGNPKVNLGCYFFIDTVTKFYFKTNEGISEFPGLHLVSIV